MKALVNLDSYDEDNYQSGLDLEDEKYPVVSPRFEKGPYQPFNYRIDLGADCVLLCDDEYMTNLRGKLPNGN